MSIADRELRAQCLHLAVSADPMSAVRLAGEFFAFVTGETDKSPREKIEADLDAADVR